METPSLFIVAIIIYLIINFIICTEIAATAEKKGLKYFPILLISFFATPIAGILYAMLLLKTDK